MITRRRLLTISAAALATPATAAAPLRWHGTALGAQVALELHGPADRTRPALDTALADIRHIEQVFSLYSARSALTRLNRQGVLADPPAALRQLCAVTDHLHAATDGLFDPTVQALWAAQAAGQPLHTALHLVDWTRVKVDQDAVRLGPGQSLSFNGLAQGFATDRVTQSLTQAGLSNIHVNIGEQAARGDPRRLAMVDPEYGAVGTLTLTNSAVATSSPAALRTTGLDHIFSPRGGRPNWSTITVLARAATLADGLSTALCLAGPDLVARCRKLPGVHRILALDHAGDLTTF